MWRQASIERIEHAHRLGHLAIEQALAQAVGGDGDARGLDAADELGQDLAGERDQRQPRGRGAGQRREARLVLPADPPQRVEELRNRRGVAVQHLERIAHPLHVEPGDRPPRAADEEEALRRAPAPPCAAPSPPCGSPSRAVRASGMSASCSGPSGEVAQARISPPERCASSIEAPPMSQTSPSALRPAEKHALGRQPRLLRAAGHVQLQAGLALHLVAEGRPVRRLAHRRGGDGDQAGELHPVGQRREAVQRRQRPDPALGAEAPGLAEARRRGRRAPSRCRNRPGCAPCRRRRRGGPSSTRRR